MLVVYNQQLWPAADLLPLHYSLSLMTLLFCLVVVDTQSDGAEDMSV